MSGSLIRLYIINTNLTTCQHCSTFMTVFSPLNGVSVNRWRTNVSEIILSYASFRMQTLEPVDAQLALPQREATCISLP